MPAFIISDISDLSTGPLGACLVTLCVSLRIFGRTMFGRTRGPCDPEDTPNLEKRNSANRE
jgi:hypothetical protein